MNRLEHHPELALARKPDPPNVSIELIRFQPCAGAAFSLACQASGLEDKEIYLACGIDAGTFSRIKKGEATLQSDKHQIFAESVGNTIYHEWLAFQIGCTLVMIKTEAERRAEEAEKRAQEIEAENRLLKGLLMGKAA